jgi:signal transduction histidine kinase
VDAIRQLTPEEARRGYPVRIRGVVTLRVPSLMFVQDETGGIYVSPANTPPSTKKLQPGTLVEIEGVTTFGRFSPYVCGCQGGPIQLQVLGRATPPEPLHLSLDELADPRYHNQWIEVSGVVRDVSSQVYPASPDFEEVIVTLGSASGRARAIMFRSPASEKLPTELIGAGVRVRGVFNAIISDKGQFLGMWLANSSLDDFQVEHPSPGRPFELPVRPIAALMHFDAQHSVSQRVRIRGIVTQVVAGRGMYVQGEDAGILVTTIDPPTVQAGDHVDVAGFLAHGNWNPVLEDAVYETRETGSLPEPLAITTEQALGGDYDCRRVTVEGLLVQASPTAQQPMLVLRSAETVFQASFAESTDLCLLAAVAEGSWLRVEGICVNRRGKDLLKESPPGLQERPRPAAFHLLLASPADVTVLRKPPWWNMRRVLVALGAVLVVALAAIAWVAVLRYRVAVQTQIIRQQLAREAVYEERGRIARELHDTLEQVLGGISFHLHAVDKNLPHAPQSAQQVLGVARSLLEYSRAEARRSVADLRASLLEDGDLAAALRAVAAQAQDGTTTAVEAIVEGEPRRLPGRVEASLLRIAQEALTNALKHGKPSRVEFKLAFNHEDVTLRISDDGTGFEVEQAATADGGHFGLLGMRERAEKIQASFAIHSMPGQGTEILVAVKT